MDTQPPHPRTAIVTGAARGIGAAVATRLAHDGLAVAVLDRSADDCATTVSAITQDGGTAIAVAADVADQAAVADAMDRIVAELGPPTVVVNNAGFADAAPLQEMTLEQWESIVAVDLTGPFIVARAACPYMVQAGWGRIINMSSISALGDAGRASYASAKAGLIGFTKSLALELGHHGVTANAIAPGFIVSEMTAATARRLGRDFDEHQHIAARSIPVGRVGWPGDIAHAASFMASPEAGFVSGQVLYVAGGPVD
jgi:NAD(P)-dependent dehydrogenase (short-subunit alcohol dehydrogenase family)